MDLVTATDTIAAAGRALTDAGRTSPDAPVAACPGWTVSTVVKHVGLVHQWASGLLRDYPLTPTFSGGSIKHVLPRLKLIEGLNQKGLFTYAGRAKPGVVSTVARLFGALPAE